MEQKLVVRRNRNNENWTPFFGDTPSARAPLVTTTESAEHSAVRRMTKGAVAKVPGRLLAAIPNGASRGYPAPTPVIGRNKNEQIVELLYTSACDAMIAALRPIDETFPVRVQKPGSRLEKVPAHMVFC